jgi:hypothetical protein
MMNQHKYHFLLTAIDEPSFLKETNLLIDYSFIIISNLLIANHFITSISILMRVIFIKVVNFGFASFVENY